MSMQRDFIYIDRPQKGNESALLRRAFIWAILTHMAVLAAFALVPAWTANGVAIEEINVFDKAPVAFAQPVEVVSMQELAPVEPIGGIDTVIVTAAPRQTAVERPPTRNTVPENRLVPASGAGGGNGNSRAPAQTVIKVNEPDRGGGQKNAVPKPPEGAVEQPARPGGGGGGVELPLVDGPPTVDNPALPAGGSGETPLGQLPGTGTGSGPGSGTGQGAGSGSGSGNQSGDGTMPGEGDEAGSGDGSGGEADGGGGFVSRLADRSVPKVKDRGTLTYPAAAAEEGAEGTVELKVLVDIEGQVKETEITSKSGDKRLDSAAEDWVKGWKYLPAVQDGRPREVWTIATVTFRLE